MKDEKKKIAKKFKKIEKFYKKTYPKEERTDIQKMSDNYHSEMKKIEDEKAYITDDIKPKEATIDMESIMKHEQMNRDIQEHNRRTMEKFSKPTQITAYINGANGDVSIAGNNISIKTVKKDNLFPKILGFLKFW
ncbi:MAG: hypothetical protein COB17_08655 [Sulfurimonas sp.]|nr:MAG: hypothetical protein COB17_08655 [Sulfurimonas sp.]